MPADVKAAVSNPASSSATAPSPRLAVDPPMPSSLVPAQDSMATPDELEEQLRFYACQLKSFRSISLLHHSPELNDKIREMEENYSTAVSQFYCRQPSFISDRLSAAAEQPTPSLQSAAAAEQPTPWLQGAAAGEQPMPFLRTLLLNSSRQVSKAVLRSLPQPPLHAVEGVRKGDASAHFIGGLADALTQVIGGLADTTAQVIRGPADSSAPDPELLLGFLCGFLSELFRTTGSQPDTSGPAHATEDLGDASVSAQALRVSAIPQLLLMPLSVPARSQVLLKPLRVSAIPQLLLTPLRIPGRSQVLLLPLRVWARPQVLLLPLRVSATPQVLPQGLPVVH
ncbi:hypothetical protein CRENBAI_023088 [Crenichthys baileyi]|uniref:Uncharacterized protein n=1 Tax=Crenichthys baileyi TaxID=28760 RepID=A0AAV9RI77_9TELE